MRLARARNDFISDSTLACVVLFSSHSRKLINTSQFSLTTIPFFAHWVKKRSLRSSSHPCASRFFAVWPPKRSRRKLIFFHLYHGLTSGTNRSGNIKMAYFCILGPRLAIHCKDNSCKSVCPNRFFVSRLAS